MSWKEDVLEIAAFVFWIFGFGTTAYFLFSIEPPAFAAGIPAPFAFGIFVLYMALLVITSIAIPGAIALVLYAVAVESLGLEKADHETGDFQ